MYDAVLKSFRENEDAQYIIKDSIMWSNWKNAAYAHATPFIHAKQMGYKDFWAIDGDDMRWFAEPERVIEIFNAVRNYANQNKIDTMSADIWTTLSSGCHWTFGIQYVDNSIDWIKLMKEHCKDKNFEDNYRNAPQCNMDWFFTYLQKYNLANIKSFYVQNLHYIHATCDPYINPKLGGLRFWTDGKLYIPIMQYDCGLGEKGARIIPNNIAKIDIGLTLEEGQKYLQKIFPKM